MKVNQTFQLLRDLADIKIAAVTSRFFIIARRRQDIVERVTKGEFLCLTLDMHDSLERSCLITRYPVGVNPSLAPELPDVHSARCFRQNGVPINHIVVAWSLLLALFPLVFLPCFPECELRWIRDDQSSSL